MKTTSLNLVALTASLIAVLVVASLSGCRLGGASGNAGLECDTSGDCDDSKLGCVALDEANPNGKRVCMPPPSDWVCGEKFFGDGACDCGCELQDIDCPDKNATSCAADGNNCPTGQNPLATDNTKCG